MVADLRKSYERTRVTSLFGALFAGICLCIAVPAFSAESQETDRWVAARRAALAVDARLMEKWRANKVTAAPPATHVELLRRIYLDIAGKIPPVSVVREFTASREPRKWEQLVDDLLDSPAAVTHSVEIWRGVLVPEAELDLQVRFAASPFDAWLRRKFLDKIPYDAIARELLTVSLTPASMSAQNIPRPAGGAVGFYVAKEFKPENLAAATARVFLGTRIECAQCHDHPFDRWKREQFWSYAACFAEISPPNPLGAAPVVKPPAPANPRELQIPGTNRTVRMASLDGSSPAAAEQHPRAWLAKWVTSADNPWFAKAATNRMWGQFFGRGLIDPIDDISENNPPSHPELLDELAREFAKSGFDLHFLVRTIVSSEGYRLSSAAPHSDAVAPQLFARMTVKGMRPAELFDSLAQATGYYEKSGRVDVAVFAGNTQRSEFLEAFSGERGSEEDQGTTILQALAMMNGSFVNQATGVERSVTLSALAGLPQLSTADRIEALYLATLSRPPNPAELQKLIGYVESGGPEKDPRRALGDVFWSLLNSTEFVSNH